MRSTASDRFLRIKLVPRYLFLVLLATATWFFCTDSTAAQTYPCGTSNVITIPANSPPIQVVDTGLPVGLLPGFYLTSFNLTASQSWATVAGIQIIPAGIYGIFERQSISYDVSGLSTGQYCAYFPQTFSGASSDPNCSVLPSGCFMSGSSTQVREVDVVAISSVQLIDPVPDLASVNAVRSASQLQNLRTRGRVVSGVAADGVTQVVVKIQTNSPGHQFTVTLLNDQGITSSAASEDGAIGNPGDTSFSLSTKTVTSGGLDGVGLAYAFAVYRAPLDFARPISSTTFKTGTCNGSSRTDDLLECRAVFIQVQDITANTSPMMYELTVIRPPVTMIHGIWDSASAWDNFSPLVTSANSSDLRFSLIRISYDDVIENLITASDPPYAQDLLVRAQNNSLGFNWNASNILSVIKDRISDFKNGNNAVGIPVAAVQSDVVAHSMGGVIARTIALQAGFLNDNLNSSFGQGYIHKLITIDSPHRGSPWATQLLAPQEAGGCLQHLFAKKRKFIFNTVTITNRGTVNGAVGDLVDNPTSGALQAVANSGPHPLPTSTIVGVYTAWSDLDSPTNFDAIYLRNRCLSDPLAQRFTAAGWQQIFNNAPNDGIVTEDSQLNSLIPSPGSQFFGYAHSPGTERLGFSGPSVLDSGSVPSQVIFLLNRLPTNTVYYTQFNP